MDSAFALVRYACRIAAVKTPGPNAVSRWLRDGASGAELEQSFGGETAGEATYLATQRKLLRATAVARP